MSFADALESYLVPITEAKETVIKIPYDEQTDWLLSHLSKTLIPDLDRSNTAERAIKAFYKNRKKAAARDKDIIYELTKMGGASIMLVFAVNEDGSKCQPFRSLIYASKSTSMVHMITDMQVPVILVSRMLKGNYKPFGPTDQIMNHYENATEGYLLDDARSYEVATESMGKNPFKKVFYLEDKIQFINPNIKIKNKMYPLPNPCTVYQIMETIVQNNWTEKDFIKAIENNIVYNNEDDHYYYDDVENLDAPGPDGYKFKVISRKKDWDALQCIPFYYEQYNGSRIFYSKAKHMFIYCEDRRYLQDNLDEHTITWARALKEFKNLKK